MIDAIVRIFRSVKDDRKLVMDESYMLLHIISFLIYLANLAVLDGFYLQSGENTFIPSKKLLIVGLTVVITGFFSQVFLLLIIKKQVACLKQVIEHEKEQK